MFSINQILKMQVDETGEATDTFVNPMAGMSIVAQDLANLYGESSVSEPLNAEPVRRPDVIDEDELSDESWAKQIQPKLELEEQTNTCSQCGLTFKNRQSLRRHKSTHSDFKPFRCDQCDYSTTLKEYLRKHMKFRHKMELTNELSRPNKRLPIPTTSQLSKAGPKFDYTVSEPTIDSVPRGANTSSQYKCEECSYSTDKYNFLRKHSYSHLGYQTYSCDVCDFVTTKNRYLVNHMKKHLENSAATADAGSSTSSAISFVSDVFSVSNPEQETQIQILKTATLLPKKSKVG